MAKKIAIDIDIQGTKDVLELQKALRDTKKELKETEDVKAYDNLAKDLVKIQAQLKEARKRQRQAVDAFAATDKGIGAYSRLSAQLRVARNNLKDLAAEGKTTGSAVESLTNEVSQLDTQLKDIDRSVGKTNREVGDYENAIRKATGLTEKQTGAFTRMTGKLDILKRSYKDIVVAQGSTSKGAKILKKDIDRLEKSLKSAGNSAKKSGKRIGGIQTQIRGLGPAAAGLASGFLIFSELPQILDSVGEGFNKFGSLLSASFALNQSLNESIKDSIGGYVDERLELENLFLTASADNENKQERKAAIDLINEQYGEYLPNLLTETSSLKENAIAQKIATQELIKNIATRAAREKLEEDIKRLAATTATAIELDRQSETTFGKITSFISRTSNAIQTLGTSELTGFGAELEKATDIDRLTNNLEKQSAKAAIASGNEFEKRFAETLTEIEDVLANTFKSAGQFGVNQLEKDREKRTEVLNKQRQKAIEAAQKQADKLAAQAAKNREKFLQQEIKDEQKRANILLSLSAQLILATLNNLEEGEQKQLDLEENASQKRIANLKNQNAAFEQNAQDRIDKAVELFGAGSAKVLELEKQLGGEQIQVKKQIDGLIQQEEISSQTKKQKIIKDFAAQEKANSLKKIELKKQEAEALAQIEEQNTKKAKEEADKQIGIRQKATKVALDSIKQALGFVNDFATALNDKEIERLQGLADERAENIEGLQEQLQSASGLEKAFLEQRVSEETKAAKEIAAQQERARKENAIAQKAIAITQAIINGALAVTAILAQTTDPTPVQAFRFAAIAAAIATTAAQVAIIAAQPLATGGVVSGAQNIKTQSNGDNILTTLTRGEVVLNKGQQAKLGGAKTFANIGVPGFAGGGVVSPPIGAPAIGNLARDSANSTEILLKMSEMITATNNRIDRIEVLYTTNTGDSIKNDSQDRKEIKTRATI